MERSVTVKKRATAAEIQADLQQRIATCPECGGSCRGCGAPMPRLVRPKEAGGANWIVERLPGLANGCFGAIVRIVDQARLEYELIA